MGLKKKVKFLNRKIGSWIDLTKNTLSSKFPAAFFICINIAH